MTTQFLRDYVVYVRKHQSETSSRITEIRKLRITFNIRKTIELEPNTCELLVYNLNEDTRKQLTQKGQYIHIEAGYQGDLKQIFQGTVKEAYPYREGTEWVMKFLIHDGLVPLQDSTCFQSFAPGTPVSQAASNVAERMKATGMKVDPTELASLAGNLPQGFSHAGSAAGAMKKLLEASGHVWSIQDGKLQIRKRGQPAKGTVTLITPDSGLIGSPTHVAAQEQKQVQSTAPDVAQGERDNHAGVSTQRSGREKYAHVKAKFLLNGDVKCGTKIAIQSESVNGVYLVDLVTHRGDSWSGEWATEVEAVAVSTEVIV